jgi:hypothetical protein
LPFDSRLGDIKDWLMAAALTFADPNVTKANTTIAPVRFLKRLFLFIGEAPSL